MPTVDNYFAQPPAGGSDNPLNVGGTMNVGGAATVRTATFTFTAGAANVAEVAIALTDGGGTAVASAQPFNVWLSDSAAGTGLTATTASGTVTAKAASGEVFGTLTAKKALVVQPLATGIFTLEITDTAKTTFYVAVQNPFTGQVVVSRIMATGDYGA